MLNPSLAPTLRTVHLHSDSPSATARFGERLARHLRPGDIILLAGDLGAGKTCFSQGIGRGLRVAEAVKSSSFVLVNEYHGRLTVYHADLFRLSDPAEIAELALEETSRDGVLLVEWPDRAWDEMPDESLLVHFAITGDRTRQLRLEARGGRYEELLGSLEQSLAPRKKG